MQFENKDGTFKRVLLSRLVYHKGIAYKDVYVMSVMRTTPVSVLRTVDRALAYLSYSSKLPCLVRFEDLNMYLESRISYGKPFLLCTVC